MSEPARPGRASLTGRLLGTYAIIFVGVILLFSAVVTRTVSGVLQDQIIEDLVDQARVMDAALLIGGEGPARAMAEAADARLTIIRLDGTVEFDSQSDASDMEDHGTRPEVVEAWNEGTGTDTRESATLADERLYVAVRSEDASHVIRLSVTSEQLSSDLGAVRTSVLNAAAIVGIFGVGLVWYGARRVARPITELTAIAEGVADGDLDPTVRRSTVAELDRLGLSIGRMASQLGRRIKESDEQRRTLEAVLGALPQGVLLIDDDFVVYANSTAQTLVGPFEERLSSIAPRALHRCVRAARSGQGERTLQFERGSPARVLSVNATKLGDERVLVVVVDVTERLRVEAIRRDFVADASHELKTPVASVLASAEAIQLALSRDVEKARGFAARLESSAQQLSRIVEDLLDLSRLETSDRPQEPIHLDRIVTEEVESVSSRAAERGINLTAEVQDTEIVGSASDLALAVRNLCDNALRFTNEGGSVTVRLERQAGDVAISVQDTGVGIPTRALERVFERFYRVDEARSRATGGTGLGLSIVRHVAERHGGTVTVKSQLGVGSTFTITLPLPPSD